MLTKRVLTVSLVLPFLAISGVAQASHNYQLRVIEGRSSSGPVVGYDAMGVPIYRKQLGPSQSPVTGTPATTCTRRDKRLGYC